MNPAFTLPGVVPVLALVAARVVPVIFWLPAFGGRALPFALRAGLGIGFATFIGLQMSSTAFQAGREMVDPSIAAGFVRLALLGVRELAIGISLAFLASLIFMAGEVAGRLIDVARRSGSDDLSMPFASEDSGHSAFSALYALLGALLFSEIGGPAHVLSALARSYEVLPLAAPSIEIAPAALIGLAASIIAGTIEVAVALAAPVLLAVWLTELTLAMITRAAGGSVGPFADGASVLTPLVAMGLALLGLGVVRAGFEGWLARVPAVLLRAAEAWARG